MSISGNFLKSGIVAVWLIIQDSIDIEIKIDGDFIITTLSKQDSVSFCRLARTVILKG